jgi:hypothetical protein
MGCKVLTEELHERVIEHVMPPQRGRRDSQGEKVQKSQDLSRSASAAAVINGSPEPNCF